MAGFSTFAAQVFWRGLHISCDDTGLSQEINIEHLIEMNVEHLIEMNVEHLIEMNVEHRTSNVEHRIRMSLRSAI